MKTRGATCCVLEVLEKLPLISKVEQTGQRARGKRGSPKLEWSSRQYVLTRSGVLELVDTLMKPPERSNPGVGARRSLAAVGQRQDDAQPGGEYGAGEEEELVSTPSPVGELPELLTVDSSSQPRSPELTRVSVQVQPSSPPPHAQVALRRRCSPSSISLHPPQLKMGYYSSYGLVAYLTVSPPPLSLPRRR